MQILKFFLMAALAAATLSIGAGAMAGPSGDTINVGGGGRYGPNGMCGGIAGFQCPQGQVCDMGGGRPYPDQAGHCRPRTRSCPRIYRPVCGVDHRTYANSCLARNAGVRVWRPGRCRS